jgi:alcohol dehydrogenase (cytochrome c)
MARPAPCVSTLALWIMLACPLPGSSQTTAESLGPYTDIQAAIGGEIYQTVCAMCHLPDFQGAFQAPQLAGPNFRSAWGARPVVELLGLVQASMPPQAAGSLTTEEAAAVVAYLLQANEVAAGTVDLGPDTPGPVIPVADESAADPPTPDPDAVPEPLAQTEPRSTPEPGRLGTVRSPETVQAPPEFLGTVSESVTGFTQTYRSADWLSPVNEAELRSPPEGEWLHWRGSPGSNGYSPLSQIDTENVHRLQLAWVWGLPAGSRYRTAPLERDGVLFLTGAGDLVQALDAREGTLLWEYRRKRASPNARVQSVALWEDQLLVSTNDAALVALDARNGTVRWEAQVEDPQLGYGNTAGPIVADGRVINGINGCTRLIEESCFITAHDARTGAELWRTYTIARPGEPGGDTWGDLPWELRGGVDVWNGGSWDPALGLVYFGTAQAKPWVAASRGLTTADSTLYANSTLALNVEDGTIAWYRQHVPGESLDMDEGFEQVLADVEGRPVLLAIGKHGVLWKLDRRDGSFLGKLELSDTAKTSNPRGSETGCRSVRPPREDTTGNPRATLPRPDS